jgi:Prolyl oligopeptidase family
MTGVADLVRSGIADPKQLFLYSSSNGASAIDQLLTQTQAFRAAVSHGGVSDWLGYYQVRHPLGDEAIPGFWVVKGGGLSRTLSSHLSRISGGQNRDSVVARNRREGHSI